jgi:6-phosphogluconolactonase/glucosamine-6-phosphate isomerase/deaminase
MAEVVIVADEDAAGALVADAIVSLIRSKPDAVLGLATGSTPLASYRALGACAASRSTSTSACPPGTPRAIAR